jgi:CP12 domain
MELQELINDICEELEGSFTNVQRRRYLRSYLEELLEYQKNNPDKTEVPSCLQLFCSLNPEALECKMYDV